MKAVLTAPIRFPVATLLVVVAASVGLGLQLGKLRSDVRPEKVFPERDPRLAAYQHFIDVYGKDDETAFCLLELPEGSDVLSVASLERVHAITEKLAEHPLVDDYELVSLSRASFVRLVGEDGLEVQPLYEPKRAETWDRDAMDAVLAEHPAFKDRLLDAERRIAGFLIPMAPGERTERTRTEFAIAIKEFWANEVRDGERAWLEGFAITNHSVLTLLREDSARSYPVTLILILLALAFLFRRVEPVVLTVVVVVASVVWTLGVMATAGIPMSYLSVSVPVMIVVVGVGDAVHLISRYYQCIGDGLEKRAALTSAVTDVGVACFFTSATTAAGFLSLQLSQVELVRELGGPMAIGVGSAWLLTFTVLPPALLLLPAPPVGAKLAGIGALEGVMARVSRLVRERPGRVAAASLAIGVVAGALVPLIRVESRMLQDFDPDEPLMATRLFFEDRMGGIAPLEIVIEGDEDGRVMDPDVQEALFALTERLRGEEFRERGVLFALSLPDYLADMWHTLEARRPGTRRLPEEPSRAALAQLLLGYEMANPDPTTDLIDFDRKTTRVQLRVENLWTEDFFELVGAVEAEARDAMPDDVRVDVTGMSLMAQAINESLVRGMLESFAIAFVTVIALVLIFFRSIRLTVVAILPNVLPIVAVLAFMALTGVRLAVSTSIVFSIVFGIAVDDTIHFVAGLHHQTRAGRSTRDAVDGAIRETGTALCLTSIVLALGFSILWLSHFKANHYFGTLASVTVAFALLADLFLLPALVILSDRRGAVAEGEAEPRAEAPVAP